MSDRPEPPALTVPDATARLARAAHVAVALDFDGVLAPLGPDPMAVRMVPGAAEVLEALARGPRFTVALVSGRRMADLVLLASPPAGAVLVGSHGAEHGRVAADGTVVADVEAPTGPEIAMLVAIERELQAIAASAPDAWVEHKAFARVLHTRQVTDPGDAAALTRAAVEGPGSWEGVHAMTGKAVVELAVRTTTKADGVAWVRAVAAESAGLAPGQVAVVFAGDDVTDENALASLGPGDVGIKVGDGVTSASVRVADEHAVVAYLRELLAL